MKVCSLCQRCYDDEAVFCLDEGHPALPESRDRDRECVAGYHLEYLLKSGQNWETYRAVEAESGRPCLIRIILPNARNGEQFLGEATLAATLFNPSFADVYDAGTLDGGGFFAVTEETEGETVRQVLNASGPPKLLTTVEIVRQTADALHSLHAGGLVHRAIRPENIVLTTDTDNSLSVRLQSPDFGGAIERSIVSNKFLIDTALDSLRYYAPEQFTGDPATPQTDLYSLGIVLFEMLAGVPPFDAPKATALIAKHKNQPPPELRIADFNLRMLLTHTLKESLHKQARLRQSSAMAFARQLRHIEQLATHVSTPPPAGAVPVPTRERPVVIAAAATPSQFVMTQPVVLNEAERPVTHIVPHPYEAEIQETAAPFAAEIISEPVFSRPGLAILESGQEAAVENSNRVLFAKDESNGQLDQRSTEPLRNDPAGNSLDRTRLKFRKRRLRSKIIRAVNAIADDETVRAFEVEAPQPGTAVSLSEDETNTSGIKLPDRNAVEAAMTEALAARSGKAAKKIELRLFDDEVPTDTDALQPFAIDQTIDQMVTAPKQIDLAQLTPKMPKHIEWQQPEDDIPSEADVLEVLAIENVREAAQSETAGSVSIQPEIAGEPTPPITMREHKVVTRVVEEPPVQAISPHSRAVVPLESRPLPAVVTDPTAVISEELHLAEAICEKELLQAPPVTEIVRPAVAAGIKRTRIEFDESADAVGRPVEIIEVRASEDPDRTPVVEHDPDEITLVAPPSRRIRIDVKQPGRWKVTPPAGYRDTFVPTILGGSAEELPAPDPDHKEPNHKDPILSVYYGAADPNRRSPYRSLVIGAGFLVSVVLLLFGNVLVREEARTEAAANTVASKTFPPRSSPPQAGNTSFPAPARDKPIKAVEKPVEAPDTARGDRSKNGENPVTNTEQSKSTTARSEVQNRPTKSASVKPVSEKPRVVPSTIVISSDNGKVRSKVEPQDKQTARTSSAPTKKPAGTRPRIVMLP